MEFSVIYFYFLFVALCTCALGVIFSPRMYLSVLSLFLLVCFSSVLYIGFNAGYLALFQFILCGLFLSVYIFLLLKKIGRLNLNLKLASPVKIITGAVSIAVLGVLSVLFFNQEFDNSLYSFFNVVVEKSSDLVNFKYYVFPLSLLAILIFVAAFVMRVFLEGLENRND